MGQDAEVANFLLQQGGDIGEQQVAAGYAVSLFDLVIAIQQDEQQGALHAAIHGARDQQVELFHEIGAVVKPGEQVLLAQCIELLFQFLARHLATDDDLGAGLAVHACRAELHGDVEGLALRVLRRDIQGLLLGVALAVVFQEFLELGAVLGGDHVHDGHTLDVLHVLVTEGIQVGLVGVDVHALVDVGDGIAGAVDEGAGAFLGFVQHDLGPPQGTAVLQVLEFARHDVAQALRLVEGDAVPGAELHDLGTALFTLVPGDHHHGQVAAEAAGDLQHLAGIDQGDLVFRKDQVEGVFFQRRRHILLVLDAGVAHHHPGIAQDVEKRFGFLGGVEQGQELEDSVATHQISFLLLLVRRARWRSGAPRDVPY